MDASSSAAQPVEAGQAGMHDAALDARVSRDADEDAPGLRLVARVPEPDAENVWARAPIVLGFSAALDPASVTPDAIRIEAATGPVASALQLSSDRLEVRVVLLELPPQPSQLTAVLTDALRDEAGRAFGGERWSWSSPLWHRSEELALEFASGAASLAADDRDRPVVAWLAREGEAVPELRVARVEGERWQTLAVAPLDGFEPGDRDAAIHVDGEGTVWVAWVKHDRSVMVRSFANERWTSPLAAWTAGGRIESLDVSASDGTAVIAVIEAKPPDRSVHVLGYDAGRSSWSAFGRPFDRARSAAATVAVLAADDAGGLALAWLEHDGHSDNLYVARRAQPTQPWTSLGAAVELDVDARVATPALALTNGADLTVSWSEGPAANSATYVARWRGRVQVLGGALDPARAADVVALAHDAHGGALALLLARAPRSSLSVARYNGSPAPPFGLTERLPARCDIPGDGDPAFPQTLSETGCFDDVPSRQPASGLIAYSVNSPLWSDGTLKRRFLSIPDTQTIGFTERDSWTLPVGTVLVKEFLLPGAPGDPRDVFPLETRLLVKRCEPGACRAAWQGYSYQWDDTGSEARLLHNESETVFKDWAAGDGMHRHGYPGRDECMHCHATAAGGALGLQTGQLNRNHDYGAHVDNQIRALGRIGLLGDGFVELTDEAIEALFRLPAPEDPGYSRDARVRSYLHANCSQCHRPDGRWPVVDFQFDAPLRSAAEPNPNICDKLAPGDARASLLFAKISARGQLPAEVKGEPMPPLGSLVVDARQLPVIEAWIDEMKSCP